MLLHPGGAPPSAVTKEDRKGCSLSGNCLYPAGTCRSDSVTTVWKGTSFARSQVVSHSILALSMPVEKYKDVLTAVVGMEYTFPFLETSGIWANVCILKIRMHSRNHTNNFSKNFTNIPVWFVNK